jgi:hypothetical protein
MMKTIIYKIKYTFHAKSLSFKIHYKYVKMGLKV